MKAIFPAVLNYMLHFMQNQISTTSSLLPTAYPPKKEKRDNESTTLVWWKLLLFFSSYWALISSYQKAVMQLNRLSSWQLILLEIKWKWVHHLLRSWSNPGQAPVVQDINLLNHQIWVFLAHTRDFSISVAYTTSLSLFLRRFNSFTLPPLWFSWCLWIQ